MIEAGKLNKRITFQTGTVSGLEGVVSWNDTLTVWAQIEPLSGSWLFTAQQANSKIKGRIFVRYNPDITSSMRIKYGSRYFRIESIINIDEANHTLQIMYSEWAD